MRNWLDVFLPLWAVGSMVWVTAGFIILPDAFRRPLLNSPHGIWTTSGFDLVLIDWKAAHALLIVIGPPTAAILIALAVVMGQHLRQAFRRRRAS
jgi:hypothetical protein